MKTYLRFGQEVPSFYAKDTSVSGRKHLRYA